ncbi:MAG: hypothetical protein JW954_07960 [Dehalococcoidaceae bacterium]|nr:hypothetical protein [Dehalococcoidaceae bacterium]
MAEDWLKQYGYLRKFLKTHPGINIDHKTVLIPVKLRQEYLQLMDNIRESFIRQFLLGLLADCIVTVGCFDTARAHAIQTISLEYISVTGEVDEFLTDPGQVTSRIVNSNLTDLVKGLTDCDSFEADTIVEVNARLEYLLGLSYEKYIVLTIINMLDVKEVLGVCLPKPTAHQLVKYSPVVKKEPPRAIKTTILKLTDEQYPVLGIPDFIISASKSDKYLGFRSNFIRPHWFASEYNSKAEWCCINDIDSALSQELSLVFFDKSADGLAMIADAELIRRPDLVITCQAQKDWMNEKKIQKLNFQYNTIKPTQGFFVISKEPIDTGKLEGLNKGIRVLEVGFDQSRLSPIINAMNQLKIA